jgi:transcriptional regulator with XRE-family HTH domain
MPSDTAAWTRVAQELDVNPSTVQRWVRGQAESGVQPPRTMDEKLDVDLAALSRREREELLAYAGQLLEDTIPLYEQQLREALQWSDRDPNIQALEQIRIAAEHIELVDAVRHRMIMIAHLNGLSQTDIARAAHLSPIQVRRITSDGSNPLPR